MEIETLCRPEWTCGRYDEKYRVAIFYNLIEGMAYFFEDVSADVICEILSVKKNETISISHILKNVGLVMEELNPFLSVLLDRGLITTSIPNQDDIAEYRNNVRLKKRQHVESTRIEFQEQSVINTTDAERLYTERVESITSVMFELTYRCSEACIHCYNPGATRNGEETNERGKRIELGINDYKRIIDELYDQGLVKVCLSGGDPFSKPIVWDILNYLYQKGIATDIFTNGISIYKDAKRLAAYYPRTIGISFYSNIPEVHDSITRVKGSHGKTLSFIKECSQLGLSMYLKCCIMKPNVKSYYTVKDVAYMYGALPQFDLNITDSVEGDVCASTNLRLNNEMMEIVLRDKDLPYYISAVGDVLENSPKPDGSGKMCNAGFTSICITPEGNIQPCCAFPMKFGSVKQGKIVEVLKNSKPYMWWRSKVLSDCSECHQHPYCVFCQMCAGNNYIANGTPLKPSKNNCTIAKERYYLALKMKDGYDPLQGKSLEDRLAELTVDIPVLYRNFSKNYRDIYGVNEVSQ